MENCTGFNVQLKSTQAKWSNLKWRTIELALLLRDLYFSKTAVIVGRCGILDQPRELDFLNMLLTLDSGYSFLNTAVDCYLSFQSKTL